MKPSRDIPRLLEIMAALRTPGTGCPWDLEQNFATIAPYTLEEAYEVADAIARGDLAELREELGDLLLQVVFHARMAAGAGAFDFGDVVQAITAKLIRRHPHVFGDDRRLPPEERQRPGRGSRPRKRRERGATARRTGRAGRRAGRPPRAHPRAQAADKAGRVGFDWDDPRAVLEKIAEETAEVEAKLRAGRTSGGCRGRRPSVRRGQSRPPPRRRPEVVLRGQRQVRAALCRDRACVIGARKNAQGCEPDRNGQAVGRGEGGREGRLHH